MATLPKSLRSLVSAMQSHLLWEYWLSFKGTAWEIMWGAGILGVPLTIYTLYRSPSKSVLLSYILLVAVVAGYLVWRTEHVHRHDKGELARLHEEFGIYMTEGENIARELRKGIRQDQYGPWLQKRGQWVARVSEAITALGLPDEAAAFRHAGERDADATQIFGPNQALYFIKLYMGQLDGWREKLADIVARRLKFEL